MKSITIETAETLALRFRNSIGLNATEPISVKTIIRKLNIQTVYRPLSKNLYGLSLKTYDGEDSFMLINSSSTRGRQHFTIAHELYHLYYDDNPIPHFCNEDGKNPIEKSADKFASALLMPKDGIISYISPDEITQKEISVDTALRIEQLYNVSHSTLVLRLKDLKLITQKCVEDLLRLKIITEAKDRGYDLSLYKSGNSGLVIGDFGVIARKLYDDEKISEGYYIELLNMISYGSESKDSVGC